MCFFNMAQHHLGHGQDAIQDVTDWLTHHLNEQTRTNLLAMPMTMTWLYHESNYGWLLNDMWLLNYWWLLNYGLLLNKGWILNYDWLLNNGWLLNHGWILTLLFNVNYGWTLMCYNFPVHSVLQSKGSNNSIQCQEKFN